MRNIVKIVASVVTCGLIAGLVVFSVKDDEDGSVSATTGSSTLENSGNSADGLFSDQEILSGLLYGTGAFAEALGIGVFFDDYESEGLDGLDYESAVQASIAEIEEMFEAEEYLLQSRIYAAMIHSKLKKEWIN